MLWQFKAALMDFFSVWPGGERLHYWTQRNVTKSLPRSEREFREKFGHAKSHLGALTRHGRKAISNSQFYEFGAGWDLAIPFCLYALGVKSQILVDIFELAHVDLLNDTLEKLKRLEEETGAARIGARLVPEKERDAWVPLLEQWYGIRYVAPCDARGTGLQGESVDYITSTDTLEHIPEEDIRLILRECRRILQKDGILSFVIDYHDHYSYCDQRITAYNFLRYPPNTWKWFNPRFHFQNRLRHKDYIRLAVEQGFEVVEEIRDAVLPKDIVDLEQINVARPFRNGYRLEELAIRRGHLVLRPASA
jgi:SAM-dependent methyltransferase